MRATFHGLVALILVTTASSLSAGAIAPRPEKPASSAPTATSTPTRVGGETIADALPITILPFTDTGTTCGHTDDYDVACYSDAAAPDVVYSFTPDITGFVDIDLCGSSYDTKVFVLDTSEEAIACSDDTYWVAGHSCGQWNAALEFLAVEEGQTYYIVVDGYATSCGNYELRVAFEEPCPIACPAEAIDEGEAPMEEVYDQYNAGCYSNSEDPWPYILSTSRRDSVVICGENGFYHIPAGTGYDNDWWKVTIGDTGEVVATLTAQRTTNLLQIDMSSGQCATATAIQETFNEPCASTSMTMAGTPGTELYFWVHTIYNEYPNGAYPYSLEVVGGENVTAVGPAPRAPVLRPPRPNPFNPATTISWVLPSAGHAVLEIFDGQGRSIATLLDGPVPAGPGSAIWDGRDSHGALVSSGVYFCRLRSGDLHDLQKMVMLK